MSLSDRLSVPPTPDARRQRRDHPKGMEPGIRYEAGAPVEVTAQLDSIPEDESCWREEIERVTGLTVPDERRVLLSQVRYWGEPSAPMIYARFSIEDRQHEASPVDATELLRTLRDDKRAGTHSASTGDSTFVLAWNDWQAGKLEGGGTPALAQRLDAAYDAAADRIHELRSIGRGLGHLVIVGGGDLIEGCAIAPNHPFTIDTDRRTQIRNVTTFILDGLDRLAPMFERVTVLAVGGNHGENRINGKRTNRHDNDDCAVFEHAALACARDENLSHVDFVIAQDEPVKTLDVNGWILGTTHGHVFRRGATPEQKAWNWYQGQAAGRLPAGDSDVMLTHHYHSHRTADWGACLWLQAPAMDGGSAYFTDSSGQHSKPGMLSFVMSPENRCFDLQVLT